jgi:hypothetical protein
MMPGWTDDGKGIADVAFDNSSTRLDDAAARESSTERRVRIEVEGLPLIVGLRSFNLNFVES